MRPLPEPASEMLPGEVAMLLAAGERARWVGRSGTGGVGFGDLVGGAFGLAIAGGAGLFLKEVALAAGWPLVVPALAALALGAWIAAYALYLNPRNRGSRVYAVTDRRLLFVTLLPRMRVKEIPLNPHLRVEGSFDRDGRGTLAFLDPITVQDPEGITVTRDQRGGTTAYRSFNPYTFHRIEDAAGVARLIEGLRREVRF